MCEASEAVPDSLDGTRVQAYQRRHARERVCIRETSLSNLKHNPADCNKLRLVNYYCQLAGMPGARFLARDRISCGHTQTCAAGQG